MYVNYDYSPLLWQHPDCYLTVLNSCCFKLPLNLSLYLVGNILSYWCFSPGFSMQDLVNQGVRCIILTSGTLSPLASFTSEMRMWVHVLIISIFPGLFSNVSVWLETFLWVWRTVMWSSGTRSLWAWLTEAQMEYSWAQHLTEGSFYTATCLTLHVDLSSAWNHTIFCLVCQISSWKHGVFRQHCGWAAHSGTSGGSVLLGYMLARLSDCLFVWMLLYSANLSRVVPHGLLVFFPSFPLMEKMLDFWRVSRDSRGLLFCSYCTALWALLLWLSRLMAMQSALTV